MDLAKQIDPVPPALLSLGRRHSKMARASRDHAPTTRRTHRRTEPHDRSNHRPARAADPGVPWHCALLQGVAARSRAAHADEQPRPRCGRALGRPGRVRRLGEGGAELGGLSPHRGVAPIARGRRDAARAIGQGRRHLQDASRRAPRSHRQCHARARLGRLGALPQVRGARPHHVRPDDRGLVDLHRHAGHPAGHVRDVRRLRGQALRRLARGAPRAVRRARGHGRRPAARRHLERGRGPLRRDRSGAHRAAPAARLRGPRRRVARRGPRLGGRGPARGRGAVDRAARQCGRHATRRSPGGACGPTSSPTRRPPTTC